MSDGAIVITVGAAALTRKKNSRNNHFFTIFAHLYYISLNPQWQTHPFKFALAPPLTYLISTRVMNWQPLLCGRRRRIIFVLISRIANNGVFS